MRLGKGFSYHEAICGPMFSGKTREMHRQYSVFKSCNFKVQVFRHDIDKRYSKNSIKTHDGINFDENDVLIAKDENDIENQLKDDTEVVMIDEAQFYSKGLLEKIDKWVESGKIVVTTILTTNHKGEVFMIAGDLLARADLISPLTATSIYS